MSVKTKTRIYQRKTKSGKEQLLSRLAFMCIPENVGLFT